MNAPIVDKPDATTLMIRRTFQADMDVLWQALTDPKAWMQWFGGGHATPVTTTADLRPGGAWRIDMRGNESGNAISLVGEYVEIDRPRRVSFTWAWEASPERGESLVTYTLSPGEADGETTLILTHERLVSEDIRDSHAMGWTATLELLAAHLAGGKSAS